MTLITIDLPGIDDSFILHPRLPFHDRANRAISCEKLVPLRDELFLVPRRDRASRFS